MILSLQEMKRFEAGVIASGISAASLMEEAASQIAKAIRQFFPKPGTCIVYFGKGNNGGDALLAANHLLGSGWEIRLRSVFPVDALNPLAAKHLKSLLDAGVSPPEINEIPGTPYFPAPVLILDGILGIGATGPLRNPVKQAAEEINRLRQGLGASVLAIDIPTGMTGDITNDSCVKADMTFTVGFAKEVLLRDENTNFTGRLAVLPLTSFEKHSPHSDDTAHVLTGMQLRPHLPRREFDSHKTNYGRIGIVAGSVGMTGAANLAATAALKAGGGMVTLYVTEDCYPIVAAAAAPEVMVRPVSSYREVLKSKEDVLAIGPGLGKKHKEDVLSLIQKFPGPMVVDADALNLLASKMELLHTCGGPRLLTPHPGEMKRLAPALTNSRRAIAETFVTQYPVTLLLKGSRTIIAESGHPVCYNTTGSPGMATAGMGDVLTGVCVALLGQKIPPQEAACIAAWICGRASEIAIYNRTESEQSLTASTLFQTLGEAFKDLWAGRF